MASTHLGFLGLRENFPIFAAKGIFPCALFDWPEKLRIGAKRLPLLFFFIGPWRKTSLKSYEYRLNVPIYYVPGPPQTYNIKCTNMRTNKKKNRFVHWTPAMKMKLLSTAIVQETYAAQHGKMPQAIAELTKELTTCPQFSDSLSASAVKQQLVRYFLPPATMPRPHRLIPNSTTRINCLIISSSTISRARTRPASLHRTSRSSTRAARSTSNFRPLRRTKRRRPRHRRPRRARRPRASRKPASASRKTRRRCCRRARSMHIWTPH